MPRSAARDVVRASAMVVGQSMGRQICESDIDVVRDAGATHEGLGCPPTTMNSTPCSPRTAQKRSSGLCSRGSSNGLHPQRRAACPLCPTRALGRHDTHVGADQRNVHAVLVVLPRRPERLRRVGRGIAVWVGHRSHSTELRCQAYRHATLEKEQRSVQASLADVSAVEGSLRHCSNRA
jgi:hypothetical protein